MTTIVTSTVGTDADYLTVALWETGQAKDLVAAGVIERAALLNEVHTDLAIIDSGVWATDATHYIWISAADGAEHSGVAGTGARIITDSQTNTIVTSLINIDLHVTGLELSGTNQGSGAALVRIIGHSIRTHFDNLILHDSVSSFAKGFEFDGSTAQVVDITNCLVYNIDRTGIVFNNSNCVARIYNNVLWNCSTRGEATHAVLKIENGETQDMDLRNNLLHVNAGGSPVLLVNGSGAPWNAASDQNILSDASGTGEALVGTMLETVPFQAGTAGSAPRVMFVNLTAASEDLHLVRPLVTANNSAFGFGNNLTALAATLPSNIHLEIDIDGRTRPTTGAWDAGVHQSLTVTTRTISRSRQRMMTVQSGLASPVDVIEIDGLPSGFPHNFLSIQYFDAQGARITPSAGTVTILVETVSGQPDFEAIPENVMDSTDPATITWASNTHGLRATPANLTAGGVNTWRLVATFNRT